MTFRTTRQKDPSEPFEEPPAPDVSPIDGQVEQLQAKAKKVAPPTINSQLLMKWGLALLGDEKASEYIEWLRARLHGSHT